VVTMLQWLARKKLTSTIASFCMLLQYLFIPCQAEQIPAEAPPLIRKAYFESLELISQKSYSAAAEKLAEVTVGVPRFAKAHYEYGIALRKLNRDSEALEQFREAEKYSESDVDMIYKLACEYQGMGQKADAIRTFDRYAFLSPNGVYGEYAKHAVDAMRLDDSRYKPGIDSRGKDNYMDEELNGYKQCRRWSLSAMPILVYVDKASSVPYHIYEELDKIVKESFSDWQTSTADLVKFTFVEDPGKAQIQVLWTNDKAELENGLLGLCSYQTNRWQITGARLKLLAVSEKFGELKSTCLHEIGHSLGLTNHSPEPSDIMFRISSADRMKLSNRDIKTIKAVYALPEVAPNLNAEAPVGKGKVPVTSSLTGKKSGIQPIGEAQHNGERLLGIRVETITDQNFGCPSRLLLLIQEADKALKDKEYERAIAILSNLLTQYPYHIQSRKKLADVSKIVAEIKAKQDPDRAVHFYCLSLYCNPGDKDVLRHLNKAINQIGYSPDSFSQLQNLAEKAIEKNELVDAIIHLRAANKIRYEASIVEQLKSLPAPKNLPLFSSSSLDKFSDIEQGVIEIAAQINSEDEPYSSYSKELEKTFAERCQFPNLGSKTAKLYYCMDRSGECGASGILSSSGDKTLDENCFKIIQNFISSMPKPPAKSANLLVSIVEIGGKPGGNIHVKVSAAYNFMSYLSSMIPLIREWSFFLEEPAVVYLHINPNGSTKLQKTENLNMNSESIKKKLEAAKFLPLPRGLTNGLEIKISSVYL
jgi:hypothetical protein